MSSSKQLLDIRENLAFGARDPGWLKKSGIWLLCYLAGITAPILVGYHLEVMRQAARGEEEGLPAFHGPWRLWKSGFIWYLAYLMVWIVPVMLNLGMLVRYEAPSYESGAMIHILVHCVLCLGMAFWAPASMLRYAMTGEARSIFSLKAQFSDICQAPASYLKINLLYPFLCSIVMTLLCMTGIGVLAVVLLFPLMAFGHARLMGNYYRANFKA